DAPHRRLHAFGISRQVEARQFVSVTDRGNASAQSRGFRARGVRRQVGRNSFWSRGQGRYAPSVAPGLEKPEVGPVGLAGAESLFSLGQINCGLEVRAERSRQVADAG